MPNPHLSQTERGLHQPSVRVLKLISGALGVPGETLLAQAGPSGGSSPGAQYAAVPVRAVQTAVRADQQLTAEQKSLLIAVYRLAKRYLVLWCAGCEG